MTIGSAHERKPVHIHVSTKQGEHIDEILDVTLYDEGLSSTADIIGASKKIKPPTPDRMNHERPGSFDPNPNSFHFQGLDQCRALERLNLHSNSIYELAGIGHLAMLLELNLSSNQVARIQGLGGLHSLRVLDLACNRLRQIDGLSALHCLTRLNLSYNRIEDLSGLEELWGPDYRLSSMDLRDNNVSHLNQLDALKGLEALRELSFKRGSMTNPICSQGGYMRALGEAAPRLEEVDGGAFSLEALDDDGDVERRGRSSEWRIAQPKDGGGKWEPRAQRRGRGQKDPRLGSLEIGGTLAGDETITESEVDASFDSVMLRSSYQSSGRVGMISEEEFEALCLDRDTLAERVTSLEASSKEDREALEAQISEVEALWSQLGEVTDVGQEAAEEREHWKTMCREREQEATSLTRALEKEREERRKDSGDLKP